MALIRFGGNVSEVVSVVGGDGDLEPAAGLDLNSRLFTAKAGGSAVQPRNSGGTPITISTDTAGGIPEFWVDDDDVPEAPWFERGGALPRQQLTTSTTMSRDEADDRYVMASDVGQPNGIATLNSSGDVPGSQLATVATPVASEIPRYNGDANLVTQDPITDLAAANRRWTLDQVHALAGIQDAEVVPSDFTNNTATLQTITGLEIPVLAGDVYFISAMLLHKANTGVDVKIRIDPPSSTYVVGYGIGYDLAASVGTPTQVRQRYTNTITGVSNQLTASFGGIGNNPHVPIYIEARVVVGANGNLRLQAAQDTADAGNAMTIYAGSYCLFAHVAPPESP